ncbi:MAG: AAA family ATPase, partial [Candidatus Ornithomonoglobus sp.]
MEAGLLSGFTTFEIEKIVYDIKVRSGCSFKDIINKHKNGNSDNILSYIDTKNVENLGGFSKFKEKLGNIKEVFSDVQKAAARQISMPKGVMLVGIPGCGKSLAAKVTAKELNLPLIKMDFGRVMSKYVGESEANLYSALRRAESASPCVLWIDEFEKTIISSEEGGADGNISNRLLSIFLTWLQEKTASIYVVATVNNIDKMPPELLRRGRFDEIYKVDLPKPSARVDIMRSKLNEIRVYLPLEQIKRVCNELRNYSGADIEQIVNEANILSFADEKPLSVNYLENARQNVRSVEVVMHDQVEKIREVFNKYNFTDVD